VTRAAHALELPAPSADAPLPRVTMAHGRRGRFVGRASPARHLAPLPCSRCPRTTPLVDRIPVLCARCLVALYHAPLEHEGST
jgi:hypothetical protein